MKESERGIIIGSDQKQEHLLLFFWLNYRLHNDFPVTFMDFGMSKEVLYWCQKRGEVIPIDQSLLTDQEEGFKGEELCPDLAKTTRHSWFKKPLALLKSPYETTLWIDTDCLIRANLQNLFNLSNHPLQFRLVKESPEVIKQWKATKLIGQNDLLYNSGVIAYKKSSPILKLWIQACQTPSSFRGDQEALSFALNQSGFKPKALQSRYNWLINGNHRIHPDAKVLHFTTTVGKKVLGLLSQTLLQELRYPDI